MKKEDKYKFVEQKPMTEKDREVIQEAITHFQKLDELFDSLTVNASVNISHAETVSGISIRTDLEAYIVWLESLLNNDGFLYKKS